MPLTPVHQHLALWDLQRDTGWVEIYGAEGRTLTRTDVQDAGDFGAIVSMLSDRRGLCYDARRDVIMRLVAEPVAADGVERLVG